MTLWHWLRCKAGVHKLRWVRTLGLGCTLFTCEHCRRYFAYNPRAADRIGAFLEFDCELYRLHRDFGTAGLEIYLKERCD